MFCLHKTSRLMDSWQVESSVSKGIFMVQSPELFLFPQSLEIWTNYILAFYIIKKQCHHLMTGFRIIHQYIVICNMFVSAMERSNKILIYEDINHKTGLLYCYQPWPKAHLFMINLSEIFLTGMMLLGGGHTGHNKLP